VKGNGFSKGEKDLYRAMGTLKAEEKRQEEEALERTRKFFETKSYTGIPVPSKKQENKDNFGQNTEDKLVEWEKNQVKELFVKYDTEKKGVSKEVLVEIMGKLMKDECIIGKVPNLLEEEVSTMYDTWEITDENKCTWHRFRDSLSTLLWKQ